MLMLGHEDNGLIPLWQLDTNGSCVTVRLSDGACSWKYSHLLSSEYQHKLLPHAKMLRYQTMGYVPWQCLTINLHGR